jgi:antitoxin (DNA-binding transcriptional repressor) of toxin-antitoxin stability system
MATIDIAETESMEAWRALLARVQAGEEILFRNGDRPIAVLRSPTAPPRTLDECIAMLPPDSPPVDDEFGSDVAEAVAAHRESLNPPQWD